MIKTGTPNEYRRELKKKILQHAMDEFRKNGIRAVKMDSIAKDLGISKRTVYEIYQDKEAILIDGIRTKFENGKQKMHEQRESSGNVIELLAVFYKMQMEDSGQVSPQFFADVEKYPKALALINEISQERDRLAVGFFQRGVEEGYFLDNIDYDIVIQVAKNTSQSIMMNHLFTKYPMRKLLKNMLTLYLRGLCTVKGVEQLDQLIGQ